MTSLALLFGTTVAHFGRFANFYQTNLYCFHRTLPILMPPWRPKSVPNQEDDFLQKTKIVSNAYQFISDNYPCYITLAVVWL